MWNARVDLHKARLHQLDAMDSIYAAQEQLELYVEDASMSNWTAAKNHAEMASIFCGFSYVHYYDGFTDLQTGLYELVCGEAMIGWQ